MSSLGASNQISLQHGSTQSDNAFMLPLPLSSSSSTSSEITDSSGTRGISQESSSLSKMSTASISSSASLASNDNSAVNRKHNNQVSPPYVTGAPSFNGFSHHTVNLSGNTEPQQPKIGNISKQLTSTPTSSGDNLISQNISGIYSLFSI